MLHFMADPAFSYLVGAALFILSAILTWRRTLKKPVKRFDVVEYGIVPAVLLGIFLLADSYIDISRDYALGLSLFLLLVLGGLAIAFGPTGWMLWLFLVFVYLILGNAVLAITGVGCIAMLAGTLFGFGLASARLARRPVTGIKSDGGLA